MHARGAYRRDPTEADLPESPPQEGPCAGCGAVMRIAPLAMAYEGETLTRAAEISARVTHAHPNALESAIAAAHLLRWLLDGEPLSAALVTRAIEALHGPWNRGGTVATTFSR